MTEKTEPVKPNRNVLNTESVIKFCQKMAVDQPPHVAAWFTSTFYKWMLNEYKPARIALRIEAQEYEEEEEEEEDEEEEDDRPMSQVRVRADKLPDPIEHDDWI